MIEFVWPQENTYVIGFTICFDYIQIKPKQIRILPDWMRWSHDWNNEISTNLFARIWLIQIKSQWHRHLFTLYFMIRPFFQQEITQFFSVFTYCLPQRLRETIQFQNKQNYSQIAMKTTIENEFDAINNSFRNIRWRCAFYMFELQWEYIQLENHLINYILLFRCQSIWII